MAFIGPEDIHELIETIVRRVWSEFKVRPHRARWPRPHARANDGLSGCRRLAAHGNRASSCRRRSAAWPTAMPFVVYAHRSARRNEERRSGLTMKFFYFGRGIVRARVGVWPHRAQYGSDKPDTRFGLEVRCPGRCVGTPTFTDTHASCFVASWPASGAGGADRAGARLGNGAGRRAARSDLGPGRRHRVRRPRGQAARCSPHGGDVRARQGTRSPCMCAVAAYRCRLADPGSVPPCAVPTHSFAGGRPGCCVDRVGRPPGAGGWRHERALVVQPAPAGGRPPPGARALAALARR